MIKHIFFDADGMVVNKPQGFSEVLARNYKITTEMTESFFKIEFPDVQTGKADLKELLKKYLADWGWQKSVDEFLAVWFKSEHYVDERLVKSIQELRQRGFKCYLATNQEKYRAEYMRREMGFETIFDHIFVSCDIGYLKPSVEFWNKVQKRLGGLLKQEVLVWDDEQLAISSAKAFGFNAELYTNFEDYEKVLDNYLK